MSNFKDIAINVLLIIAFIGLVISIVMLYDWTGSVLAGFLVFPAAAVMILFLERVFPDLYMDDNNN